MDQMPMLIVAAGVYVSFALLTAVGSMRRGATPLVTAIAALTFPITWVLWYVQDVLRPRSGGGSTG